jgi:ankyrin repeat protein
MSDIWEAAKAGDMGVVERLVGEDPGLLNARTTDFGMTPLMWASAEGHVGVARWLVDKWSAINGRSTKSCTALWYACARGHAPVVRLLLAKGADPTIALQVAVTPLMTASAANHLAVVRLLLADPRVKRVVNRRSIYGETALWRACKYGHVGVARALLESGADARIRTTLAPPPWPSPSRMFVMESGPRAVGGAWRRWR